MSQTAEQHSLPLSVLLHLLPGALATIVFVATVGPLESAGYPPLAGLLLAIAAVIIPFELGLLLWLGWRRRGRPTLDGVVLYREPLPMRTGLWLVPLVFVLSFLGFGLLAVLEPPIRDGLFAWLPGWFLAPIDFDAIGTFESGAWVVVLAAYLVLNAFAGPIVEELYFRGYLLPRIDRYARWAPLINTVLFSLYHFWSPWQFITRMGGVAPFAYAVWWKRNIYIGIVVHVLLNLLSVLFVVMAVMSALPPA